MLCRIMASDMGFAWWSRLGSNLRDGPGQGVRCKNFRARDGLHDAEGVSFKTARAVVQPAVAEYGWAVVRTKARRREPPCSGFSVITRRFLPASS